MTADIQSRPITATITILNSDGDDIGGPYDVGDAIAESGFEIDFPQFNTSDPNGYSPFKATLNLRAEVQGVTLNLDPRSTAGSPSGAALLAQGNRVDIRLAMADKATMNRAWPDLYILKINEPLNLPSRIVTLTLGDETQLQNLKTPEGDEAGFDIGTTTNRHTIINNYLQAVGIEATSDTISTYALSNPPQKVDESSWATEAGKIAGSAGYYLWIDSGNDTRLTEVDLDQSSPDLSLTIGMDGDEVRDDGWVLVSNDERISERLTVYGEGGTAEEIDNPRETTTQRGTETQSFSFGTSPDFVRELTEQQASNEILPKTCTTVAFTQVQQLEGGGTRNVTVVNIDTETVNTETGLRNSLDLNHTKNYNGITKAIESELIRTRQARGLAGGDALRLTEAATARTVNGNTSASNDFLDAYTLIDTEQVSVTYEYDRITDRLKKKTTRIYRPWCLVDWTGDRPTNYEVNRFGLREVERKTEEWEQVGSLRSSNETWKYKYTTLRPRGVIEVDYEGINADALIEDYRRLNGDYAESDIITSNDDVATPPDTEYQQSEYESSDEQYEGFAEFEPIEGDAFKNKLDTITVSGPYVVSNSQCFFLADLLGRFRHGRSLGARFMGAIPDWLFTSFRPGARVDVTVDGEVRAYLMDGWSLVSDRTSSAWGCTLVFLGVVEATPADVTPPVTVSTPILSSIILPAMTVSATIQQQGIGVTSNITLPALTATATIEGSILVQSGITLPGLTAAAVIQNTQEWDSLTAGDWDGLTENDWDNLRD